MQNATSLFEKKCRLQSDQIHWQGLGHRCSVFGCVCAQVCHVRAKVLLYKIAIVLVAAFVCARLSLQFMFAHFQFGSSELSSAQVFEGQLCTQSAHRYKANF